jgi:pSer/pThr/pTyr-binding forkhead associated (FHA) protein
MRGPELSVFVRYPGGATEAHRIAVTDASVNIGSDWSCHVLITIPGVKPLHVQVESTDDVLWLVYHPDGKTRIVASATSPQVQPRSGLSRLSLLSDRITSILLEPARVQLDLVWTRQQQQRDVAPRTRAAWDGSEGKHVIAPRAASRPPPAREESPPTERGPGGGRIDITLVTPGNREEFSFRPGASVTLGRTRTCDVRVPDDIEGVSRMHARLHWNNGWLVLEDLGSTNGTWMNSERVKSVVLHPPVSQQIELGQAGASVSIRVLRDSKASLIGTTLTSEATRVSKPSSKPEPITDSEYELLRARLTEQEQQLLEKQRALLELEAKHLDHERRRSEHERLVQELEDRRIDAERRLEIEQRRLDEERQANQRALEALELRHQSDFSDIPATDPTMPVFLLTTEEERSPERAPVPKEESPPTLSAVVEDLEASKLTWLTAIPLPDRSVFRHLALHGSINEEEAVRLLGSPRQFRRFSGQFEVLVLHCPFKVRIETSGGLKCYVRSDESRIRK